MNGGSNKSEEPAEGGAVPELEPVPGYDSVAYGKGEK